MLNQLNMALDAYSALLCVVLGAYVLVSGDRRDRANRCFAGICACNAAMALGDLTAWAFRRAARHRRARRHAGGDVSVLRGPGAVVSVLHRLHRGLPLEAHRRHARLLPAVGGSVLALHGRVRGLALQRDVLLGGCRNRLRARPAVLAGAGGARHPAPAQRVDRRAPPLLPDAQGARRLRQLHRAAHRSRGRPGGVVRRRAHEHSRGAGHPAGVFEHPVRAQGAARPARARVGRGASTSC